MEIATPSGPALVALDHPATQPPAFLLLLTHSAGGGIEAPDLLAVRDAALALGGVVGRVLQPYMVAGRRSPGPAAAQDLAWLAVVTALRTRLGPLPLVQGGRSNGARVACRTAAVAGATGVLALAFPLHPPWNPAATRVEELRAAGTEVVVVNGDRDQFGIPSAADATRVYVLPGEGHDLARRPARVGEIAAGWLRHWTGNDGPPG
jgi:predicted alpha/beta-hydrolase family hydrolase